MKICEEKTFTATEKVCAKIQCDFCKKEFGKDDWIETQEFHHVDFVGGYGSVFGDGNHIQCDICQRCLLTLIEGRYTSDEEY